METYTKKLFSEELMWPCTYSELFYNSTYCAILMVPSYLVTVACPLYYYSDNRIKYCFSRLFSTSADSHCCSLNKVDKENYLSSPQITPFSYFYTPI